MNVAFSVVVLAVALILIIRRKEWGLGVACILAGLLISGTTIGQSAVRTVNGVVSSISNVVK